MFKKLSLLVLVAATHSLSALTSQSVPQIDYSTLSLTNANGAIVPVQGWAGYFGAWLACSQNTPAKQAVTAVLVWCVAYTLYQSAKSIGTTVWDVWHHGEKHLSPEVKREVEREVIRLLKEHEHAQMVRGTKSEIANGADLKDEQKNEQPVTQPAEQHHAEQHVVQHEESEVQQAPLPKITHMQNNGTCVCGVCRKRRGQA